MQLTEAMLQAAVRKAVELKLLPEGAELLSDCRLRNIEAVLEAALAEADRRRYVMAPPPANPFAHCRFVVMYEIPCGFDALTSKLVYREAAMLGTDDRDVADKHAEDLANCSGRKAWVVDRVTE
jgi:hypothetical protein